MHALRLLHLPCGVELCTYPFLFMSLASFLKQTSEDCIGNTEHANNVNAECNIVNKFCTLADPNTVLWDNLSPAAMNSYNGKRQRDSTRAVASLSLPGEQDRNTLSIFPHHFPVDSLIFPQSLIIFFLILVFRVGGLPTGKTRATPLDSSNQMTRIFVQVI